MYRRLHKPLRRQVSGYQSSVPDSRRKKYTLLFPKEICILIVQHLDLTVHSIRLRLTITPAEIRTYTQCVDVQLQ